MIWDIVALALFGVARVLLPLHTPDIGQLARTPSAYYRGHFAYVSWRAVTLLVFACVSAVGGALVASADWAQRVGNHRPFRWFAPQGGVSPNPGWWVLFNQHPDKVVYVGVVLDDPTYLAGSVLSFSPDSDETADREITLSGPIKVRSAQSNVEAELGVGAVAVIARRIRYLTVSYLIQLRGTDRSTASHGSGAIYAHE